MIYHVSFTYLYFASSYSGQQEKLFARALEKSKKLNHPDIWKRKKERKREKRNRRKKFQRIEKKILQDWK
jgi:hypothetical protein